MNKRLLSLLLLLALLLCAATGLCEQTPNLTTAKITALRQLAGEAGAPWNEDMRPTSDMNAFQVWQWTDWFLANQVRSLLGTVQEYDLLDSNNSLDPGTEEVQWMLLEIENTLSHFETQLEDDRLAILNGISLYQSDEVSEGDRLNAVNRILEAESEIRQIIKTISGDYESYLALMVECRNRLDSQNAESVLDGHRDKLAKAAFELELIENATNADFSISVISRHQFSIRVMRDADTPIPGAEVTVTNQLNKTKTKTRTTDNYGNAVFFVSDVGANEKFEMQLNVRITADGCRTREVKALKLHGGDTSTFYMEKNNGEPYLVMCCFNGNDILTETNTFYYTEANTAMHTFSVKLDSFTDGTLQLCSRGGENATETVIESKSFKSTDSDRTEFEFQKQWLKMLKPGTKVYFKIITKDKQAYTFDTQLDIQNAVVEKPFLSSDSALFKFFGAAGGFGFDIPKEVPFVGGSRVAVNIPGKNPMLMILPSGRAMFSWGATYSPKDTSWQTEDSKDQANAIKEFNAQNKADKLLAKAGAYRNVNTTTESKMLGNMGASVSPFVSLQGTYTTSDNKLELKGSLGATLAFKAGFTQTFTIGPVPFFAGVDFSMGISFAMDAVMTMYMEIADGAMRVLTSPAIEYNDGDTIGLTISIRLELGGTIGLGLQDVASVALRGYGYINPVVSFASSGVSADATLGMGMGVTIRVLFLKWQDTLWSDTISLTQNNAAMALSAPSEEEYLQFDNTGAEEPRLSAANSVSNGTSGVEPVETKQVFSQLDSSAGDFQYAVIGGHTYLFWIQPGSTKTTARLNWYNLTDTSKHGAVTWPATSTHKREGLADYDFAVDISRNVNNKTSSFCALTILSGMFYGIGTGKTPEAPATSILTTVLLKQNSNKGLDIAYYYENTKEFRSDNYAMMPEVFLTAVGEDTQSVYMISTCSSFGNQTGIYGQVIYRDSAAAGLDGRMSFDPDSFVDEHSITRYHLGIPDATKQWHDEKVNIYSLNQKGELSRLSYRVSHPSRNLLASGDIVNFRVYSQLDPTNTKDRLFYLERAEVEKDKYIHQLKCITVDLNDLDATPVKSVYDGVEINADCFDIVRFGSGVYLYWTECSTPSGSDPKGAKEKYMVRCLRYDPGTDTVCGPFNMVELKESPNSIKLQDSGTGYYSVDLQSSQGSYLRQSLSRFTYTLVSAAELTTATPKNPCVCAGDYAEIVFAVRNTGNVPLSGINVKISNGTKKLQTLHIDCANPENNSNTIGTRVMNGAYTVNRISGMYDALNQDSWETTQTNADGTTTVRSVTTTMLMPGDTHYYAAKMLVPTDWDGNMSLTATIESVESDITKNGAVENGALMLTAANDTNDLPTIISRPGTSVQMLNTDVHDLALSAQRFKLSGEDYVHVSIMNLSGNTESNVTPILTASYRGETLFTHRFIKSMGDDFGYSMDIPLRTLTRDRSLPEVDLYVSTNERYDEFVDSDNYVHLQLSVPLCIIEQPVSVSASVGQEAQLSVAAAGGKMPYSYQWQRMTGEDRWENIPDAKQDTYRIESVKEEQNGMTVRCVVTDQSGDSANSDSATLTVLPQTGDSSHLTLWLLLALSSVMMLVMVYRRGRSR